MSFVNLCSRESDKSYCIVNSAETVLCKCCGLVGLFCSKKLQACNGAVFSALSMVDTLYNKQVEATHRHIWEHMLSLSKHGIKRPRC
eukprot:436022-Amphidinium_carterae.1